MTFGRYLEGVVLLAVIAAALAAGAVSLRARLVPGWSGALARLAEAVLALAGLIGVSTVLGAAGALSAGALVAACVAAGLLAAWLARRTREAPADAAERAPAPPADRVALAAAVAAVAVVAAQWTRVIVAVLHGGMHYFDSLSYHMPFAARMAQGGSIFRLFFVEQDPLTSSYPGNGELVHADTFLLLGRDFFSAFVNLGWLVLLLLAAWCVGRRWGRGPNAVIAVCVLIATPNLLATAPGEGTNDVMSLALLLAAAAFLVNSGTAPAPLALAGLAAGLALGTRLGLVFPVVALAVGVLLVTPRRRIAAFLGPLIGAGGFWYLRNLVLVGNPFPALHLGPLPHVDTLYRRGKNTATLVRSAGDGHFWTHHFFPGVHSGLGDAWPVLLAAGAAGAVLALVRARGVVRALGGVALVCILGYAVTPGSAAAGGQLIYVNIRYVFPGVVLGLALLALDPWLRSAWRQRALSAALLATLVVTVTSAGSPWVTRNTRPAILGAAAVVALAAIVVLHRRRPVRGIVVAAACVAAAGGAFALSWHEARLYNDRRYNDVVAVGNPLADLWRAMAPVSHARIGFANLQQTYPLYGPTHSNRVVPIGHHGAHGNFRKVASCAEFADALRGGRYRYVVVSPPDFPDHDPGGTPREDLWLDRIVPNRVVYRLPELRIVAFELLGSVERGRCGSAPGSPAQS